MIAAHEGGACEGPMLKIFSPKNLAKKVAFFDQTTATFL
jgi:hypothetical protein